MDLVSTLLANNNLVHHIVYVAIALLVILLIFTTRREYRGGDHRKIAPEAGGGWPLIGHLHLLASDVPPHRILGGMADKYGPIFYMRLGRKRALIVSSWEIAKECFGTNDKVFLDRPHKAALSYAYGGVTFALGQRFGQYWHNMRRISSHELLSKTKLDLLEHDRSSEVTTCVKHLFSMCRSSPKKVINMSEWSSLVTMNVMTQMIVRKSFNPNENDWLRFVKSIGYFTKMVGTFVISDVVPFTECLDLNGHFKNVKRAVEECDCFISGWVEERVRKRNEGNEDDDDQDFLDVVLRILENDPSLSHPHSPDVAIKATILGLIIGGADTSSSAIKWVFSLLVNHPKVLTKVQNELDEQVGKTRWIEESDMKNLPYLMAVINETLRLIVPLNVPRESLEDCTIAGYHIPKGTILIVNLWKLHRDPRIWSNPDMFQPERFLSDASEYMINGSDKNYIFMPFSAGRKSCSGMTVAMQMMLLVIGRVLQGFDLATPDGEKVDMREGLGLTNPRATPLKLVLTPRLSHELY